MSFGGEMLLLFNPSSFFTSSNSSSTSANVSLAGTSGTSFSGVVGLGIALDALTDAVELMVGRDGRDIIPGSSRLVCGVKVRNDEGPCEELSPDDEVRLYKATWLTGSFLGRPSVDPVRDAGSESCPRVGSGPPEERRPVDSRLDDAMGPEGSNDPLREAGCAPPARKGGKAAFFGSGLFLGGGFASMATRGRVEVFLGLGDPLDAVGVCSLDDEDAEDIRSTPEEGVRELGTLDNELFRLLGAPIGKGATTRPLIEGTGDGKGDTLGFSYDKSVAEEVEGNADTRGEGR